MATGRPHSTTPPRKGVVTQTTSETLVSHAEPVAFAPDAHAKLTGRIGAGVAT